MSWGKLIKLWCTILVIYLPLPNHAYEDIFEGTNVHVLSQEQQGSLAGPFRDEKIVVAIKMMHPSKALVLDGFHAAFYQRY